MAAPRKAASPAAPGARAPRAAAQSARPAGKSSNSATGPAKSGARTERYHHGALHEALLTAAEAVLNRDGLGGLTLRAVARQAGVSHAAPTHHFSDLVGLLSELAAVGFTRFNAAMSAAGASAGSSTERALARAMAYVAYARANPGMYLLMFRTEKLDMERPALRDAADASFSGLAGSIGARRKEMISRDAFSLAQAADIARAWSLVHGYTMLTLDGRLTGILERLPPGTTSEDLLAAMLQLTIRER